MLKTNIEESKRELDKLLFQVLLSYEYGFKLNENNIEFEEQDFNAKNPYSKGFENIKNVAYEDISKSLNNGFIFFKPFSTNLLEVINKKRAINTKYVSYSEIEDDCLNIALLYFNVKDLKAMNFGFFPKKINIEYYKKLFDEKNINSKTYGKEIIQIIENFPLIRPELKDINSAFKAGFTYLDRQQDILIETLASNANSEGIINKILERKEHLVKCFFEKNKKFFSKSANPGKFIYLIKKLEPMLQVESLIEQNSDDSLFEEDTWKYTTVEVSKSYINKKYPIVTNNNYSDYNHKTILTKIANIIVDNNKKYKWNFNVDAAHVLSKKTGNYIFHLSHNETMPNVILFQKAIKESLDYLKPALEKINPSTSRADINVSDLIKVLSQAVLDNELDSQKILNKNKKNKL